MNQLIRNRFVKLIDHTDFVESGYDLLVANAARVSMNKKSDKFTKIGETQRSDEALLSYMADPNKNNTFDRIHFTPFCHPQYLFLITMRTTSLVDRTFTTSLNQVSRVKLGTEIIQTKAGSESYTIFLERGSLYHYIQLNEIHPYIMQTAPYSVKSFTRNDELRNYVSHSRANNNNVEQILNNNNLELIAEYHNHRFNNYTTKNDITMTNMNDYMYNGEQLQSLYNLTREQYLDLIPATFRIAMPIVDANQYKRHGGNSQINEISRRYVEDEPMFHETTEWRSRAKNIKQGSSDSLIEDNDLVTQMINLHCLQSNYLYQQLLELNVAPELARRHLPLNIYTTFYQTGPLSLFDRICYLRDDPHAQKEIREYAQAIKHILKNTIHNRVLEY